MINFITILRQIFVYAFLIAGTYFLISTTVGMIRFPDLYTRLHAASKCLISGVILILLGCIVLEGFSYGSLKLTIIIIFLLITNPVANHVIAKLAYNDNILPKTISKNPIDK